MSGYEFAEAASPWLGAVPSHWRVSRFGYEASVNGGQVDPRDEPWASMVLVAPNHIESGTGRILGRETAAEQGADSGKYLARAGQILYSKIRPALNKVTIAVEDCLCSADMYAMSFRPSVVPRYALYYMLARPFNSFATVTSMRVKMPKINREELAAGPWLVPPSDEQRAIADYLDRETACIDTLIEEQQRLIELLRERRGAVVSAAIGTGWDETRLGHVLRGIKDGTHGSFERLASGEGRPLLGARNIMNGAVVIDGQESFISDSDAANIVANGYPLRGDVLLVIVGATIGKTAVYELDESHAFQRSVAFLRPNDVVDSRFLWHQIQSKRFQDELALRAKTSAQPGIYMGDVVAIPVYVPPIENQRRIAADLDHQTAKIDTLIAETERFIELSKERRSALITAAVTGQIDVREVA